MAQPAPTPHVVRRATADFSVIALVPARNEASTIAATIKSLQVQSRPPERIIVVVNNTTDDTAKVARLAGAEALVMEHNDQKKAGALNYGLEWISQELDDNSTILVMDGDTTLDSCFIEVAVGEMSRNHRVGGVSSVFVGRDAKSLLGAMQQMEYLRYKREIRRNGRRAFVLSGTASLIRWKALREIREARAQGDKLPEGKGYYDTRSLTEDNELTFALLALGWQCPAPGPTSTTDVMDHLGPLHNQRKRWYQGALGNISHYGRKMPWHMRWIYWRQQVGLALAVVASTIVMVALGIHMAAGNLAFSWFFLALILIHLSERVISVWKMGVRYRIIALSYFPELFYAITLLIIYVVAAVDHVRGREASWHTT